MYRYPVLRIRNYFVSDPHPATRFQSSRSDPKFVEHILKMYEKTYQRTWRKNKDKLQLSLLFSLSYYLVENTFLWSFCKGYEPFVGWAARSGSETNNSGYGSGSRKKTWSNRSRLTTLKKRISYVFPAIFFTVLHSEPSAKSSVAEPVRFWQAPGYFLACSGSSYKKVPVGLQT